MEKIDPYKHKEAYLRWKEGIKEGILGISKQDSVLILRYLEDMEMGMNVSSSSKKGSRSYSRLTMLKVRLIFLSKHFKNLYLLESLTESNERQLHEFFTSMRNGTILKADGNKYLSVGDYVKTFKAFWHWYMKVKKKESVEIEDITTDLDTSKEKPRWVYLTEDEVRSLCDSAKFEYRVMIMFLFDSGIRSPTEMMNVRVSDLYDDCKELNIRDEISKTFGRRIKLMICPSLLKSYININGLGSDDYLFKGDPKSINQYLKRLAKRVLGEGKSPAGQKYSDLTMYDFRHCSCCYWLPRYKSESALKFRFGWKKSDKIHYYSEMLGMRDTIREEDLLIDVTKTEIENRLKKTENKNEILEAQVENNNRQMEEMKVILGQLKEKMLMLQNDTY